MRDSQKGKTANILAVFFVYKGLDRIKVFEKRYKGYTKIESCSGVKVLERLTLLVEYGAKLPKVKSTLILRDVDTGKKVKVKVDEIMDLEWEDNGDLLVEVRCTKKEPRFW